MESEPESVASEAPKDPIASVAGQMTVLSTGDRARLRRIYLTRSYQADGVVAGLLHRAGVEVPEREESFAPWRLVAHVAALLSGTAGVNPHAKGRRFGTALQAAGYSENRLLRLTAVRGAALHEQIALAARRIAHADEGPIDLWTVLRFAGLRADQAQAAEEARIRIARDYYAAVARSDEGESK